VLEDHNDYETRDGMKIMREVALLFLVTVEATGRKTLVPRLHSLSVPFEDNHNKLFWLGEVDPDVSIGFLTDRFARTKSLKEQEGLIRLIGIHPPRKTAGRFLTEILTSRRDPELRKQAAFYLGRHPGSTPISLLVTTARMDPSSTVRRYAVFGLAEIKSENAVDALISLAREAGEMRVRKAAITSLGDIASHKVTATLSDLAVSDEFTEIQKRAVYALEDLPGQEGIPILIRVARSHPKYQVRKSAIYCLGDSEDPRALQALIDIIREQD
jgi:hypothetical protein